MDRDLVIDSEGRIYTVVGNSHPAGYVYAYLKYIPGEGGPWRGYRRVLRSYGIRNVLALDQEYVLDPRYGVTFPALRRSMIRKHLLPEDKAFQILRRPEDELEERAAQILSVIGSTEVGITGSLLVGIHHSLSDVDVLVYGCKRALEVMEGFNGFEEDREWLSEGRLTYGIDDPTPLYSKSRRGKFNGVKYSVNFVSYTPYNPPGLCEKKGEQVVRTWIQGGDCRSLFNPAIVDLYQVKVLGGAKVKPEVLVTFEGVYSTLLFRGGEFQVKGMAMECDSENIMVLGDREVGGWIKVL